MPNNCLIPMTGVCMDVHALFQEGNSHLGAKASRVTFLGKDNRVLTTGFSRMSERQYAIWDIKDLSKPLKMEMIDTGSGALFPFFDPSTSMIYLAGKVRYNPTCDELRTCHIHLPILSTSRIVTPCMFSSSIARCLPRLIPI